MIIEYPSWDEIKANVSKQELLEIVELAIKIDNIQLVIESYIEANYEGTAVPDIDRAYEEARDEK